MVLAAGGGLLEGWGGMVRLAALSRGMVMLLVCTTPATLSARFEREIFSNQHCLHVLWASGTHPGTIWPIYDSDDLL